MSTLIITRPPQFLDPWFIEIEQVWDEIEAANNDLETRLAAAELILASSLVTSVNKFGGPLLSGAVTLSEGTNITITQVGQDIEIAATATPTAADVSFTPYGDIAATNVQDALEELDDEKAPLVHVHAAADVTFTPAGNIAATDVQAAIEELDAEKADISHTHVAADITDFDEAAQDAAAQMIDSATHDGVSTNYDDGLNTLTITNTDKGTDAVSAHVIDADPHPQYVLKDLNFSTIAVNHTTGGETAILADSSGGPITITLSSSDIASSSFKILIKDIGNASTNNITIDTQGAQLIDGLASISLSVDYGWVWLQSDGTNLHVIG